MNTGASIWFGAVIDSGSRRRIRPATDPAVQRIRTPLQSVTAAVGPAGGAFLLERTLQGTRNPAASDFERPAVVIRFAEQAVGGVVIGDAHGCRVVFEDFAGADGEVA
jgi:hypothetical protein